MYIKFVYFGVFLAIVLMQFSTTPVEAKDIWEDIKELDVFRVRDGSYVCPLPLMGERCPSSNWLFYFRCCGDLNTSCCFRLQDWAVSLIAVFIIMIIISAFVNIIRCIFCF